MSTQKSSGISRRAFLGTSVFGLAGLTILPSLKSCASTGKPIKLGFIGMGQQAMYLLNSFLQIEGVEVVAGCDVYGIKRQRFERRVMEANTKAGKKATVKTYERYRDLLARNDINAVVIAVPDHWHALIAIAACEAKKDVYLEKPLTFTIKEGQALIQAVRRNGCILGVGSQQRSDANFQYAVKMVQDGALGNIEKVNAFVGGPPIPYNLPEEQVPSDLNWDLWLGPNPYVHYNHELDPIISLDPPQDEQIWGAWRWYKETGGGFTTDWGAHMFDIAQWGLGMDKSGPVEISPAGYQDLKYLTFKYANGTIMTEEPFNAENTKGVKFWGAKGWIEISREFYKASDKSLEPKSTGKESGPYETAIPHQVNFIKAVRSRKDPQVPVEIGHRSCTVCNLGNISYELGRPIKWDPATEKFVNDPEAEKFYHRIYREGYSLPKL
jgi:predicted dehydrogenase